MPLSICMPFEHLTRLKEQGVPFVVINRCIDDPEINQVHLDDRGAGYSATKHLLELGHARIGTISGPIEDRPARRSATERHRGWLQALEEYGLTCPPAWIVVGDYTYEGGYQAAREFLSFTLQVRESCGAQNPETRHVV